MIARGERVRLRATVKATTGTGEYKQVTAVIPGTDPSAPEVWVKAHDNYRNTGGGNNLTGVGATISHWPAFYQPGVTKSDISILELSTSFRYNAAPAYSVPQDSDRFSERFSVSAL